MKNGSSVIWILLLCFVLVNFPFVGSVGASSVIWSQTYGGVTYDEEAFSLVEASDGGYAATGDGMLFVKTDEQGNVEWKRAYEGNSLIATSDGGYAMACYTPAGFNSCDFRLRKIDANGNLEWSKTYGGSDTDRAFSLVETPDGGFAVVGDTYSFAEIRSDFWLVKTDRYGKMEWNRTYGGPQFDGAHSVIVTSDGGFMIAGYRDFQDNWVGANFWLIKTDAYGNMLWNKTYSKETDKAYCVIETMDGGFAVAGSTGWMTYTDVWVVKTDEYGNMEWNRTYGDGVARALVELSDGCYVFAGGNRLIKTDTYGDIVWTINYDTETINSVIQTSDGGYALAGTKQNNFWLSKTDEYGVIPEFPSWVVLPLFLIATFSVVVFRKKLRKSS